MYHKWIYAYKGTRIKYVKKRDKHTHTLNLCGCYVITFQHRVVTVKTVKIAQAIDMNNENRIAGKGP